MNFIKYLLSVFVLFFFLDCVILKKIPDYIKKCKWDQKTINECSMKSLDIVKVITEGGIPELNVPVLDPFFIDKVNIAGDVNDVRQMIKATGYNVTVEGFRNYVIEDLHTELGDEELNITIRLLFPNFHVVGGYKLDTKILSFLMTGDGKFIFDSNKTNAITSLHAVVKERDGAKYLFFDNVAIDISVKDYNVTLEQIKGRKNKLLDVANMVLNREENREEMKKFAKPYLEATVAKLLLTYANDLVQDIPLEELLPQPDK